MALSNEWNDRIEAWKNNIERWIYEPLGSVDLTGFVTAEQLSIQQAAKQRFRPMKPGASWGGKWEYGWFKARITVPRSAAGRHLVLHDPDAIESVIYLDGKVAGSVNWAHRHPTLARSAKAGQTFDLLMELYAGHGPTPCATGPVPQGVNPIPEPGRTQRHVPHMSYGLWHEEAFQLMLDLETLIRIRRSMDPDSLRVVRIDRALKDFTSIVDFEAAPANVRVMITQARRHFAPLLKARNGDSTPEFYCFGHAHLDTAWLWPIAESERKVARTVSEQLNLISRYPDYKFLMSQPAQHAMMKRLYPELYIRFKKAVKAGSIIADGGMWVEADTNVPSGESLIRQFLHGKRYIRDEFGVDSRMLWLPDVFGYSAALPQIMKGCEIDWFTTQKIFWNYHGEDRFPYHNFMWQGLDGTEVVAHIHEDYNSQTDPAALIYRWKHRVQKDDISTRLFPFGWGDGGGGPTRHHVEYLRRAGDLEGVPRCRMANPTEFYNDLVASGEHRVNHYVGELYFTCHRGTYTSQAKTKLGNRRSELALRDAELWSAVATQLKGFKTPIKKLDAAWKKLLMNQFHDILPGSSIERVYKEAEADLAAVVAVAYSVATSARSTVLGRKQACITVFNSLGWSRTELVELPADITAPVLFDGQTLPVQRMGRRRFAEVPCRPCGWTSVRQGDHTPAVFPEETHVTASTRHLENDLLKVTFDASGTITRITDKLTGLPLNSGPCNAFKLFKDIPSQFDAWDIDSQYETDPVRLDPTAGIKVLAQGPLFAALELRRVIGHSELVQEIWLRRDSRRIDFRTRIDWKEKHRMLKVGFATDIHAREALHEVQFGHLPRPTHRSTQYDKERFEVSAHKWSALAEADRGVAVLNDCKYGVNVFGRDINLTLLRSSQAPDAHADLGRQEFSYAFYAWHGNFVESGLVHEGYDLNVPVVVAPGDGGDVSFLSIDSESVIIDTVKPAEDDPRDVVVRLYESARTHTRADLQTWLPIKRVEETTMLETKGKRIGHARTEVPLVFRPFEVKTLRLSFR